MDPRGIPEVAAAFRAMDEGSLPDNEEQKNAFLGLIGLKLGDTVIDVWEPQRKPYVLLDLYVAGWVVAAIKGDDGIIRRPLGYLVKAEADATYRAQHETVP